MLAPGSIIRLMVGLAIVKMEFEFKCEWKCESTVCYLICVMIGNNTN